MAAASSGGGGGFFDAVDTSEANARFMQATQINKAGVQIRLTPFAELQPFESRFRERVTFEKIVQEPLGMHFLSKFYAEDGVGEEVAFLSTVEQLVEGKDVLDTCCELLQNLAAKRQLPAATLSTTYRPFDRFRWTRKSGDALGGEPELRPVPAPHTREEENCNSRIVDAATVLQRKANDNARESELEAAISAAAALVLEYLKLRFAGFFGSKHYRKYIQAMHYGSRPLSMADFEVFRVLGRGAFGVVFATQKRDTRAVYALKQISKRRVKLRKAEWAVINERRVLAKMQSPFVLNLKYAFADASSLFLVTDVCTGGDLKFHQSQLPNRAFSLERAKMYAAEVLLGLEHIHSHQLVYRDLKPENVLLNAEGHAVISDLGLTVRLQPDKPLRQQAGSPGYWAPEVASRAGTYVVSDLWSWGVLLYEMLAGARPRLPCDATRKEWSPFSSDSAALAADPSAVMVVGVPFDEAVFGASARDLLSRVLEPDPRRRLGATRGAAEVREHPFFKGLDWERLEALELEPLFKPADRTVHAPALDQVSVAEDKEVEAVELTAEDQAKYADFEYVSLRAVQHEFLSILVSKEEKRREEAAARRRRVQAQAQAAAAKIKAAAAAPSDSSDAQTGAAVSLPPTIMSAKGKRGVCCVVS